MSNKRKDRAALGLGAAEDVDAGAAMSLEELAREGYGLPALGSIDSGRIVSKPVSIYEITPDSAQPRRAIPSTIRQHWDGQPGNTAGLFNAWIGAFAEEFGVEWDMAMEIIEKLLAGQQIDDNELYDSLPEMMGRQGVAEAALMPVIELAASIRRDGLQNPVTLVRAGGGWRLETGERRWLAYHLLYWASGDEQFAKIPAREVKGASVWAQATENNARRGLNAISKARQIAILLMDLYTAEGARFEPYEAFEHDRHYYAQVADGNEWRIPRGKGEMLLNAMGLKDPGQLRQYRMLLRLPDAVWTVADDFSLAEQWLRETQARAVSESMFLNMCLMEAEARGYTVTTVTVSTPDEDFAGDDLDGEDWQEDDAYQPAPKPPLQPVAAGTSLETPSWLANQRSTLPESNPPPPARNTSPAAPPAEPEAPEAPFLQWAYKFALNDRKKAGWFPATMTGNLSVVMLNEYAARGLLEAKAGNGKMAANAYYRIAPGGCALIRQPEMQYATEQPTISPEEEQAKLEMKINSYLRELMQQIEYSGPRVMVDKIRTHVGQREANQYIDRMMTAIETLRNRLGKG